ncbi:MAG: hypothetical protein GY896_22820 [Gammaproteobacteria bacterium]|nr:hypothetical protein [Gammaproteobacteria bacterium]
MKKRKRREVQRKRRHQVEFARSHQPAKRVRSPFPVTIIAGLCFSMLGLVVGLFALNWWILALAAAGIIVTGKAVFRWVVS